MSNNCRPALDTRPIVVVIQVMERGAIRTARITTAFLLIFGDTQLTDPQEVFTTTILHAPKDTLGNLQALALQGLNLVSVLLNAVHFTEAQVPFSPLVSTVYH